jgi:uncharacterized protein (UPF0332 family)
MHDKSKENWNCGISLLGQGSFNAATSRLYYGLFQAVLLYARKRSDYAETRDNKHVKMIEVVSKDPTNGKSYRRLLYDFKKHRETADYDPDPVDIAEVKRILNDCQLMREHYLKVAGY